MVSTRTSYHRDTVNPREPGWSKVRKTSGSLQNRWPLSTCLRGIWYRSVKRNGGEEEQQWIVPCLVQHQRYLPGSPSLFGNFSRVPPQKAWEKQCIPQRCNAVAHLCPVSCDFTPSSHSLLSFTVPHIAWLNQSAHPIPYLYGCIILHLQPILIPNKLAFLSSLSRKCWWTAEGQKKSCLVGQ